MPEATAQAGFATARFKRFALATVFLTLCFGMPLWQLGRFAVSDDLFSYIPLMPFVCGYLAWTLKPRLPVDSKPAVLPAALCLLAGVAATAGYWVLAHSPTEGLTEDPLTLSTLAWLLCLTAAGCWWLGGATMRVLAFPFFLLFFMIPFPIFVRDAIETGLQHGSAIVAGWMISLAGTPLLRDGTEFRLPGFSMEVAPECSGIHSTWILLITSLVAGHMFLRRPWRQLVLCLAVIPLALLRNGFRVFVIGELCVHVSPDMIDSPVHHHGGPIFFVLSLVPFFLLLYFLRKSEQTKGGAGLSKSE